MEPDAAIEPVHRRRGRLRRWSVRLGLGLGALFVALTAAAAGFDVATDGDSRPARQLYPGPFVRVGDTLVAYRRWGTKGTPIVLLNGAAEPSWVWHRVGPLLARKHRVYAIDLAPFGFTERRGPYTTEHWLRQLRGFQRRLGIERPLLVGHSLGAAVAASAALERPREVAGIVLLDGDAVPFDRGGVGWVPDLLVYPYYPALYRLLTGSDWIVSQFLRNAWGPGAPHFGKALIDVFQRPFRVDGTAGALKELANAPSPGLSLAELGRITVPRAVVWGEHDTVDPVKAGRRTAAALHTPLVLVPRAGHLSMLANPRAVAAAIERTAARAGG